MDRCSISTTYSSANNTKECLFTIASNPVTPMPETSVLTGSVAALPRRLFSCSARCAQKRCAKPSKALQRRVPAVLKSFNDLTTDTEQFNPKQDDGWINQGKHTNSWPRWNIRLGIPRVRGDAGGIIPVFVMTNNTVTLRNELLQLAAQIEDDQLLADACLVLRREADTIIRADKTEQVLRRPNAPSWTRLLYCHVSIRMAYNNNILNTLSCHYWAHKNISICHAGAH